MIRIVTDSMSDLTQEDARRLGIEVFPMPVRFGEDEYWEGINLSREEFFARLRTADELPKTSQITPEIYLETFNRLLQRPEDEVLCITGSSKLTGGYQSALLARDMASDPARITVVDSLNATDGQMLLVLLACRKRPEISSAAELAAYVEQLKTRQKLFGQAEDLKYLVMGGRLSPLVGKVGTALNIKPMLKIEGGSIDQAGLVRGSGKGKAWYVEQLRKYPPDLSCPLIIAGADCPEAVLQIKAYFEQSGLELPEIITAEIGSIIGTHVGPGLTVISWIMHKA